MEPVEGFEEGGRRGGIFGLLTTPLFPQCFPFCFQVRLTSLLIPSCWKVFGGFCLGFNLLLSRLCLEGGHVELAYVVGS